MIMVKISSVKPMQNWELEIVFADNTRCVISIKDRLFGPVFEPLRDPQFFAQAAVDEFGAICWPNGADLAPDAIYENALAAQSGKSRNPV
jgi:hypothetical protein